MFVGQCHRKVSKVHCMTRDWKHLSGIKLRKNKNGWLACKGELIDLGYATARGRDCQNMSLLKFIWDRIFKPAVWLAGHIGVSQTEAILEKSFITNLDFRWILFSNPGPWLLGFYWHGLTLIPAWVNNYIYYDVSDEITFPFLNFNGTTVEV